MMFYIFLQLIILFMESIYVLIWTEMIICKSSRFSHLFGITVTNRVDYAIKIHVREVICFYS